MGWKKSKEKTIRNRHCNINTCFIYVFNILLVISLYKKILEGLKRSPIQAASYLSRIPQHLFFLNRTSIPSSTRNIVFLLQLQITTHVSPFWNTVVLTVWDEDPWEFLRSFTEFVRVSLF